jgi:FAD/FMN-containing dehydrogenase/Fe-S oxidoreductase
MVVELQHGAPMEGQYFARRMGHAVSPQPPRATMIVELERRLRAQTQGEVMFDAAARGRYATDASIYQIMPLGVFVPRTQDDVASALAIARELQVPVLPRGAGTSQCGQTTGAALVLDNSKHLRHLLSVDVEQRRATVEPGMVLDHMNAQLKQHGLWHPVDVSTSAQATLGGMAGNNSCGSRSIAYGNMVHNVLGASAWLSSGELVEFGPVEKLQTRGALIADFVRGLAEQHRAEIETRWPKLLRRVGGYNLDIFHNQSERPYTQDGSVNLAHLLVGSEGTLAYTRTLTLKLVELPRARTLGVVNFPTFRAAMEAAQHIVKLVPTAVELVDDTMIELALANPAFRPTMSSALIGHPAAILLVEFSGAEQAPLLARLRELETLMGDLGLPGSVVPMPEDAAQKNLWEVRKAGLNIMMSLKGDGKPVSFIEDCAVPLQHLAEYTDALTEVFARHGTRGTWYAHASVGTLHVRPILDMRVGGAQGGAARMRAIAQEASELVHKFKGAYSGEHGDGLCRGEWIAWQFGPAINEAFRAIKTHLDPLNLFNPGKVIDPPRMDDGTLFRFAPPEAAKPYRRIAIKTALDWSAWNVNADPLTERTTPPGSGGDSTGGLAKAVEMCNNNGHCRKFDAGTMCPSYRATRDEQHLTRGRANTLRLALSGQLGEDAFTGAAMHQAMDLCVACKGCKRECPTGVDMARMKIEFLAHYKARHGFTLRDKLVAHLPRYARAASRVAWLPNLRDQLPGLAWLSEKLLGLSARRSLPRWTQQTFWKQLRTLADGAQDAAGAASAGRHPEQTVSHVSRQALLRAAKPVVLFVDTFNGYFESSNASAALRVLQAAGCTVFVAAREQPGAPPLCCGRTYLAAGMVDLARAQIETLIDALLPLARAGIPIVGLEPSCLLTLRDEALAMGLGEKALTVSKQALLFEEFIAREHRAGRFELALRPAGAPILVHGHCHQKAFDAVAPVLQVLALIPGAKPQLIESSCCGMAGSFGYEAQHHDVSMLMAEARLLPALRQQPEAIVVADGTSCRHQIKDGAQREAVHVAVLLERLLA